MIGVKPCSFGRNSSLEEEINEEEFNDVLYPHMCWHKSKRLVPVRILES